jgi:hypothetical protein
MMKDQKKFLKAKKNGDTENFCKTFPDCLPAAEKILEEEEEKRKQKETLAALEQPKPAGNFQKSKILTRLS